MDQTLGTEHLVLVLAVVAVAVTIVVVVALRITRPARRGRSRRRRSRDFQRRPMIELIKPKDPAQAPESPPEPGPD